jgi:serine/threonine protein kinase
MSSELPPLRNGDVLAERYRLDDEITIRPTTQVWRGWDARLQRRVSVRLIAADLDHTEAVKRAAIKAAAVDDPTLLSVLDIVEAPGLLAIISEWTDWPTLEYVARNPMSPQDTIAITLSVAAALRSLHEQQGVHGCIRPASVHLDRDKSVKLRGYEVDAALKEVDQTREQAHQQDAQAILNVFYQCLCGRWPQPDSRGRVPSPSRIVAHVPPELEQFWRRNWDRPLNGRASVDSLMAELSLADTAIQERTLAGSGRPIGRYAARAVALVAVGTAVAALTMTGITQAAQQREAGQARLAIETDDGVLAAENRNTPVSPDERIIPVRWLTTLDPDGDGTEYPHLLPNVNDGDSGTAWTTKPYYTDDIGGKRGVGVVFDLGYTQSVSALDLQLIGNSTDFLVLAGSTPWGGLDTFIPVANVRGAGQDVFVRLPRTVEARTIVVWFTRMSQMSNWSWVDEGYRAGIREATVFGPSENPTQ